MRTVVVPPLPGNFSALGLLIADVRRDFVRTRVSPTAPPMSPMSERRIAGALRHAAETELVAAGFAPERRRFAASLDMRYLGQSFELSVPVAARGREHRARSSAPSAGSTRPATARPNDARDRNRKLSARGMGTCRTSRRCRSIDRAGRSLSRGEDCRREVIFDGRGAADVNLRRETSCRQVMPYRAGAHRRGWLHHRLLPPGWSVALDAFGCLVLRAELICPRSIDPITLEVLTQALISTVREMRATVCRTASSVAIYDAKDFSCGLFAPDSQVVAQSEDIGSHVVPLPWSVRSAMAKLRRQRSPRATSSW